ncbi:MAG: Sfum_1244 family protein [Sulfuricella sp.]
MNPTLLRTTVQLNCHISDAQHARNYTLCTYLLKMREFYRWEQGYPVKASLPRDELGDWITNREMLWEQLEETGFEPLNLGQEEIDPFETTAINRELTPQGLVYSGGYGGHAAAHFFLAELLREEERHGLHVLIAGREHARDMTAPPAMLLDGTLFIRRESMRRMLWEKIEEWQWKQKPGAMARAMACYDFGADFDLALERMTDNEVEAALLHEVGEWRAEQHLGEEWGSLLLSVSGTCGELVARAVRDHLADSISTLPALLEQNHEASLHFYFANLGGMRRALFPELGAAYQRWIEGDGLQTLRLMAQQGADRWLETARQLLEIHRNRPEKCAGEIGRMYEK